MENHHPISILLLENHKAFFTLVTHELAQVNITILEALVLDVIKDSPKTVGEISKAIDLSYSTVSGIVDRLEKNQHVVRVRDEHDKRVVWVSLSERTHELGEKIPFLHEDYYADLLEGMSGEEIIMIKKSLSILLTYFNRKQQSLLEEGRKRKEE